MDKSAGYLLGIAALVVGLFGGAVLFGLGGTDDVQPTIIYRQATPLPAKAAATSPGTGGGITTATNVARDCIIDLYGVAAQVPLSSVSQVSVDDTISNCVKARGGQVVTGGQCDPNGADGCSNTFASDTQDPDSAYAALDITFADASGISTDVIVYSDGSTASTGPPEYSICQTLTRHIPPEIVAGNCLASHVNNPCECAAQQVSECGATVTRCVVTQGGGGEFTCSGSVGCQGTSTLSCDNGGTKTAVTRSSQCLTAHECQVAGGIAWGEDPGTLSICGATTTCASTDGVLRETCFFPDPASSTYICAPDRFQCGGGGAPSCTCPGGNTCYQDCTLADDSLSCEAISGCVWG